MNHSIYMKNGLKSVIFFSIVLALFFKVSFVSAQTIPCISDQVLQQQIKEHPEIQDSINAFNQFAKTYKQPRLRGDDVKIIPVVFHVFHINGDENISDAQIKDQIRILNLDYRRLNPDTANMNPIFAGVGADMKIEFRIASIDPFGDCTDGIVRYYSPSTVNADDYIKSLSVWPTDKYLNIWIVKNIKAIGVEPGLEIAGYAQFPFPQGKASLSISDGVVIRSDFVGSIGTSNPGRAGRVATHEVGHWLGLIHPFQDSCYGGDDVSDTPPVRDANFGCTPRNSCTFDNPDLPDMIENYMDYANGSCQNTFTNGQKTRVDAIFDKWRKLLYQESNLIAAGVQDGAPALDCKPIAAFNSTLNTDCEGGTVSFFDYSYNANVTKRTWSFPGGTPSTSTQQEPVVTYPNAGDYDVTLTVENANGTSTTTKSSYIHVSPLVSQNLALSEDMEGTNFPYGWTLSSTGRDNWKRTTQAKYAGNASMMIENGYSDADDKYSMISPSINIKNASSKTFSFQMAYTPRTISGNTTVDKLSVYISTNCGRTWVVLWSKSGTLLNTLKGVVKDPYFSNFYAVLGTDWKPISINLTNYANATNAMFKIEFSSKSGHNIFIDNVNVGTITDINDPKVSVSASMDVFPNPVVDVTTLKYEIDGTAPLQISLYDVTGRKVSDLVNKIVAPGSYELNIDKRNLPELVQGAYFLVLKSPGQVLTKKLIML